MARDDAQALRQAMIQCVFHLQQIGGLEHTDPMAWSREFEDLSREVARVRRLLSAGGQPGGLARGLSKTLRSGAQREKKSRDRPRLRDLFEQEFERVCDTSSMSSGQNAADAANELPSLGGGHHARHSFRVAEALRVLGAPDGAEPSELRRCYREALRKNHPDLVGESSPDRLAEVLSAWKALREHFPTL